MKRQSILPKMKKVILPAMMLSALAIPAIVSANVDITKINTKEQPIIDMEKEGIKPDQSFKYDFESQSIVK